MTDTTTPARKNLANLIAREAGLGIDAHELAEAVNRLAQDEGMRHIQGLIGLMNDNGATKDAMRKHLTAILLYGADDGWSGRGNDIKRSHFDGQRKAIEAWMVSN